MWEQVTKWITELKLQEISYLIGIASFGGLLYLIIKPLFRRRTKKNKRKNIQLYVNKIAKSYKGKIDEFANLRPDDLRWNNMLVPESDVIDFKNLEDLFYDAQELLTKEENHTIQELIETYENKKFNTHLSSSGIAIHMDDVKKIAEIAEKLQGVIKKHMKTKDIA